MLLRRTRDKCHLTRGGTDDIMDILIQSLAHARASAYAFDRAATVRERLRTSETFNHLIVSRPLTAMVPTGQFHHLLKLPRRRQAES